MPYGIQCRRVGWRLSYSQERHRARSGHPVFLHGGRTHCVQCDASVFAFGRRKRRIICAELSGCAVCTDSTLLDVMKGGIDDSQDDSGSINRGLDTNILLVRIGRRVSRPGVPNAESVRTFAIVYRVEFVLCLYGVDRNRSVRDATGRRSSSRKIVEWQMFFERDVERVEEEAEKFVVVPPRSPNISTFGVGRSSFARLDVSDIDGMHKTAGNDDGETSRIFEFVEESALLDEAAESGFFVGCFEVKSETIEKQVDVVFDADVVRVVASRESIEARRHFP